MPKIDAANWIPVREDLETDSRVLAIAEAITGANRHYILGPSAPRDLFGDPESVTRDVMRDITIVALLRVWAAFTHHTKDGVIRHASSLAHLDTIARLRGFGQAMSTVGWAVHDPATQTITLPNFTEYNAPNKNGERQKTKNAERQQRHRDKLKAEAASSSIQCPASSNQPPVTPTVTSRTEESNVTTPVTPSLSISHSISESKKSDSDSEPFSPLSSLSANPTPESSIQSPASSIDALKARLNTLRPAWKKMPAWSYEDESALTAALPNLLALEDKDWLMLEAYMKWANSTANQGKDSHKVTSRRHVFLASLESYLDRATTHWKQTGCPKLTAPQGSADTPVRKVSPPPVDDQPVGPTDTFMALCKDLKIPVREPKPAAA